jgi:hypothetical protein
MREAHGPLCSDLLMFRVFPYSLSRGQPVITRLYRVTRDHTCATEACSGRELSCAECGRSAPDGRPHWRARATRPSVSQEHRCVRERLLLLGATPQHAPLCQSAWKRALRRVLQFRLGRNSPMTKFGRGSKCFRAVAPEVGGRRWCGSSPTEN